MGVLTIKLIKCDNLKDADFIGKTDPYVKISLEQDNFVSNERNMIVVHPAIVGLILASRDDCCMTESMGSLVVCCHPPLEESWFRFVSCRKFLTL
jgi:hypothetical protein